ncbi:MAG: glycosyltransferase family 2 protein [Desulfobaccales bacterium]
MKRTLPKQSSGDFSGISIIILTKNAGNLFQEVLESLFACTGIDKAEIILIDSGSHDSTLKYAARYPQIQIHRILPSEFGHGRTRNLGAKLAKGDIIVYLVQDAIPTTPNFLLCLVAPLTCSTMAAAYGRQLPHTSANPVEQFFLWATYPELPQTRYYDSSGNPTIQSIFFSNVCSAIKRQVWEQVPFNENLIMSEDQQWAKEVLQEGFSIIYEPAAAVIHSHNYGLRHVLQRNFDSGCSLRGIVGDSFRRMVSYELSHLRKGIKYLINRDKAAWIPYFFLHEAARSLGFALGQKSHLLPTRAKYYLSLHKYYWRRG